jgi:hypothetical protein
MATNAQLSQFGSDIGCVRHHVRLACRLIRSRVQQQQAKARGVAVALIARGTLPHGTAEIGFHTGAAPQM